MTGTIAARLACIAGLIVSTVAIPAGCASMSAAPEPRSLDGSAWTLSSLPGRSPLPGVVPTARFAAGRVAGSDGCNRYSMPYSQQGSIIEIGPSGPSTMMACPESTMAQATAFTTALKNARSFGRTVETLELFDAGGAVVATLAAQSSSLAGTSWYVTMINNGRQAVVGIMSGSTLTMAFDTQGRVSGSSGCNRYTAAYTADGDSLLFSNIATTEMACGDPSLDEQEQQFRQALAAVATLHFESDRLDLRRADGELAMILVRVP